MDKISLSGLLDWWREGLYACLPPRLRRRLDPLATPLVLEIEGREARFFQQLEDGRRELGHFSVDELQADPRLLAAVRQGGKSLVLRIPRNWLLLKKVHFPLAVRENLPRVIGFEMDRLTPFTIDQVLYDYRTEAVKQATGELAVELAVLPRKRLHEWLQALAGAGLRPAIIDAAGLWRKANLLSPAERPRASRAQSALNIGLAAAVTLLILAALLIPLWQKRTIAVDLNDRMHRVKQQAQVVLAIREKLDRNSELLAAVPEKRAERQPVVEVLREVTELFPDHTWVQQLELRENRLEIRGMSNQATALIRLLEDSPVFKQVGFRSPVLQSGNQERFHLAAQIGAARVEETAEETPGETMAPITASPRPAQDSAPPPAAGRPQASVQAEAARRQIRSGA